jgi:hypothetical protein
MTAVSSPSEIVIAGDRLGFIVTVACPFGRGRTRGAAPLGLCSAPE